MIKKIGKIGKINIEANKRLKEIYADKGITTCEIRLPGCACNNMLSFAHKRKREAYRADLSLLASFDETLLSCIPCHDKIEVNKRLTEEYFKKLRTIR